MDSITVPQEKRYRSVFEVPADYFDACRLISSSSSASDSVFETFEKFNIAPIVETLEEANEEEGKSSINDPALPRWTCNTCKAEFESLQDQRSHFKSDFHRINVKLSMAGKDTVNEEDLDDFTSDTFKDYDISSISGSEDEADRTTVSRHDMRKGVVGSVEQKLLVRLKTGEKISLWRSMVLNEFESISYETAKEVPFFHSEHEQCLKESEVVERLKALIHEPRDKTRLRIVLLAGGGHFAGCVFDGNSVVAHKTFHRYVVRARAGKKQSSKDASGRMAHSAGASLRRYNELALKKDIQDLLAAWKPYFDSSTSIFIHAPSSNRQLLYDGGKAYFSHQHALICNVPFNVRRPTLKEARRIYNQMTQVATEVDEKDLQPASTESFVISESPISDGSIDSKKEGLKDEISSRVATEDYSSHVKPDELLLPSESEVIGVTTPLHEAAQSSDADKVLELLEQGMDPCVIDERGRTPYMLANEKEVRNTFRRFMASNLDTWDWHAAKVPSALTKEMEDSQAAKQAEKDAKKKARAKELKKLRKAKEKAQAEANTKAATESRAIPSPATKGQPQQSGKQKLSKEEELKRAQAEEREKRAAAAERRMAAGLNAQGSGSSTTQPKPGLPNDMNCSCCNASLAGKVPFHRYNYKYCTTACMHLHKEILEDG